MQNFLHKFFFSLILIADKKPDFLERVQYMIKAILVFGPVAYLADSLNIWFWDNHAFATGVLVCVIINLGVGVAYHRKMKTFNYPDFFKKNSEMFIILIVTYILLEILRKTIGDNSAGDVAKILIQLATLIWPISKALKNIYILTNGAHPPRFIMERIYNFEKYGMVTELFNKKENEHKD